MTDVQLHRVQKMIKNISNNTEGDEQQSHCQDQRTLDIGSLVTTTLFHLQSKLDAQTVVIVNSTSATYIAGAVYVVLSPQQTDACSYALSFQAP